MLDKVVCLETYRLRVQEKELEDMFFGRSCISQEINSLLLGVRELIVATLEIWDALQWDCENKETLDAIRRKLHDTHIKIVE